MIAPRANQVKPVGFRFLAVPLELVQSGNLSPMAILLFSVIADNARGNRSGLCKLCNATLGVRINRSASEAGRYLAELESCGLIRREFGKSKRVRLGIAITWVQASQGTSESRSATAPQPGSATHAGRVQVGPATIQSPPSEPSFQTGPNLSTHEGTGGEDPRPTPAEIAAGIRAMIAGEFAPAMFDASRGGYNPPAPQPGGSPVPIPLRDIERPTSETPGTRLVSTSPQPTKGVANGNTPDVRAMARRVGFSAFVAAGLQKRDDGKPPWKPREGSTYQTLKQAQAARRPSPAPAGSSRSTVGTNCPTGL